MHENALERARSGDHDAFGALVDPYRRELQVHCYRILGSVQDAEDLVQETLLAAWRGLGRYQARASLRTWLYTIATNRCLNALRGRKRRPQEMPSMLEPTRRVEPIWLEPYPDVLLEGLADTRPGPAARYELTESVGLAFMTALQHLPPRQRAVLVLRDVLGLRAAEVAGMLETSEAAVKGALQRARASLDERLTADRRDLAPAPRSPGEHELVRRFAAAVEGGDMDAIVAMLTTDALLTMPPLPLEFEGHEAIGAFLRERARMRGGTFRVVPTRANGQPAFACYLPDARAALVRAYGMIVLTLEADAIAAITWFADTSVFARFGLPRTLRE